jgi:hypothetical protein
MAQDRMMPETYEANEDWDVNTAPESCDEDDEAGDGFLEDDE